jgi:hypothetical protein
LNEKVVEDIRMKTQSNIENNIRAGKYVAPRAPYGYMKSLDDCHKLIPDQVAATVVRDIFKMASTQIGLNEIVRRLNSTKTPTPIDYARSNGLQGNYEQGNGLWNSRTVKHILTNRTYTGDLVQGKDSVLVENTHEPLICRDIFDTVQKLLDSSTGVARNTSNVPLSDNILRGKIICGVCGNKMQQRKGSGNSSWNFFTCISNNRLGAGHCTGMYVRETDILTALRSEIDRYVQANEVISMVNETRLIELTAIVSDLNNSIHVHEDCLRSQYEGLVRGDISASEIEPAQKEGERLRTELHDAMMQKEVLNKAREQYRLFFGFNQGSVSMEQMVNSSLEHAVVYKDRQIAVSFQHL